MISFGDAAKRVVERAGLERAERHLASAMFHGIVGMEWSEAQDSARLTRQRLVSQYGDGAVDALYVEAARYEDM